MLTDRQLQSLRNLGNESEEAADEIVTLRAALEAFRKDAERLDWIERQSLEDLSFALVVDGAHSGEYYVSGDAYEAGYGPTLRAAIDAAMTKETP